METPYSGYGSDGWRGVSLDQLESNARPQASSSTMASFFECCFNGLLDFGQLMVVQAGLMAFDGCLDELAFTWGQFRALDRTVGTLHSGGIRDC